MGTLESDSAPPARTTSHSPLRMASAAKVMARLDEAQARLTVVPGTSMGSEERKTTSRPRLRACRAGTTTPKTDIWTAAGSRPVRAISSPTATAERSTTSMSRKWVPALTKGVRQPATMATRPPGPTRSWRSARGNGGAPPGRVQTVSARSRISSSAVASLGGGRGAGTATDSALTGCAMGGLLRVVDGGGRWRSPRRRLGGGAGVVGYAALRRPACGGYTTARGTTRAGGSARAGGVRGTEAGCPGRAGARSSARSDYGPARAGGRAPVDSLAALAQTARTLIRGGVSGESGRAFVGAVRLRAGAGGRRAPVDSLAALAQTARALIRPPARGGPSRTPRASSKRARSPRPPRRCASDSTGGQRGRERQRVCEEPCTEVAERKGG